MTSSSSRRRARTRLALGLPLLLAGAACAGVSWWVAFGDPASRHIDAGVEYKQSGQLAQAEREWKEATRLAPNNADAWELLGGHYLAASRWQDALEAFRQLARIQPETPRVYEHLAVCSLRAGETEAAYQYAEEALKRDPNNIPALSIAADALLHLNEDQKRLEYLRRLAQQQPENLERLTTLAQTLCAKHLYDEARPLLERILQLAPANAQALALRGMVRFHTEASPQGLAQTEADFQRALKSSPTAPFPRIYLGKLYKKKRQLAESATQFEAAARLLPNRSNLQLELFQVYTSLGQSAKAAAAHKRFETLQREEETISVLLKRCAAEPNNFEYAWQLGQLTLKRGEEQRARYFLKRAAALRPQDPQVKSALEQLQARTPASNPVSW